MRSILAILLACVVSAAVASTCTQYQFNGSGGPGPWRSTPDAAAADGPALMQAAATAQTGGSYCNGVQLAVWYSYAGVTGSYVNGYYTNVTNNCYGGTHAVPFSVGAQTGDFCNPDKCAASSGVAAVVNLTAGWMTSPSINWVQSNMVGNWTNPSPGSSVCSAATTCGATVGSITQSYISLQPSASGLYRASVDAAVVGTGVTCVPSSADSNSDPTVAPASCPGYVGEVNGVRTCVAPVGGPAVSSVPSNSASAPTAPITGGNPTAGPMPSTGPGSGGGGVGRTPLVGTGGNDGGGSSAVGALGSAGTAPGGGGAGSGTTADPYRAKDPCGLPGGPACRIDETGMPSPTGIFAGPGSRFDAAGASLDANTAVQATRVTTLNWVWAFPFPGGTCTPLDYSTRLGSMQINPCTSSGIALLRSLMGYLFYGLAAAYIWRLTTSGGK